MTALLLLVACNAGFIRTPSRTDWLISAWWSEAPLVEVDDQVVDESETALWVLLANSDIPCELRASDDPDERVRESINLAAAVTRDGARLVLLQLQRYQVSSWDGIYPLYEDPGPHRLDLANPRVGGGLYFYVDEARLSAESEGLVRAYEPVVFGPLDADGALDMVVKEPGEARIEGDATGDVAVRGTFRFDDLDASGSFRAQHCDWTDLAELVSYLDLASLGIALPSTGSSGWPGTSTDTD